MRLLRGDLLPDWDKPWLRQELRQLRLASLKTITSGVPPGEPPSIRARRGAMRGVREALRDSAHRHVAGRISPRLTGPGRRAIT